MTVVEYLAQKKEKCTKKSFLFPAGRTLFWFISLGPVEKRRQTIDKLLEELSILAYSNSSSYKIRGIFLRSRWFLFAKFLKFCESYLKNSRNRKIWNFATEINAKFITIVT